MRDHIVTNCIVLSRVDYQEADRILTLLTPDQGKVRVIAKGVRRSKSKLAGGIELFSVSQVAYLPSRGEIHTLISTRLEKHYGEIVQDITRTMTAYEMLRRMHKITEDAAGPEFFALMRGCFEGLNEHSLQHQLVDLWYGARMLDIAGYHPNLRTDPDGNKLTVDLRYMFDFENMAFRPVGEGFFTANHIKLLRVAFSAESPTRLNQINNAPEYSAECLRLVQSLLQRSGLL